MYAITYSRRARSSLILSALGSIAVLAVQPAAAAVSGFTVSGGSISSYRYGDEALSAETTTAVNSAPSLTGNNNYTTAGSPYLEVQLPQGSVDGWASLKQEVTSWTQSSYTDTYMASAALSATTLAGSAAVTNYAWFAGAISYENSSFVGQSLALSVTVNGSYTVSPSLPGMPPLPSKPTMPVFSISTDGGNSFTTLSGSMSFSNGSYAATASTQLSSGSFLLYADGPAAMTNYSLSISKDWTVAATQTGTAVQTLSTTVIPAQAVPEPGEWAMMLSGLLMLGTLVRRRVS